MSNLLTETESKKNMILSAQYFSPLKPFSKDIFPLTPLYYIYNTSSLIGPTLDS